MDFVGGIIKVNVVDDSIADHYFPEIRINDSITVLDLKNKLYLKTGTKPSSMILCAYNPAIVPKIPVYLNDDDATVASYGIQSGYTIVIKQNDHRAAETGNGTVTLDLTKSSLKYTNPKLYNHYLKQLEMCDATGDDSSFQKYQMSDEDYEARGDNLRKFIKKMRDANRKAESANASDKYDIDEVMLTHPINSRCKVIPGDCRGVIKFIGYIDDKKRDLKIGVALDEPLGDSDGYVNNKLIFETTGPKCGGFYDPENVEVGDYPELDPFDIT